MFLAGEAGSEHVRITPAAARSGGGGGSGGVTVVNVNVAGSVHSEHDLKQFIRASLIEDLRMQRQLT